MSVTTLPATPGTMLVTVTIGAEDHSQATASGVRSAAHYAVELRSDDLPVMAWHYDENGGCVGATVPATFQCESPTQFVDFTEVDHQRALRCVVLPGDPPELLAGWLAHCERVVADLLSLRSGSEILT